MCLSSHLIAHGQTATGPIVIKVRQCTTTFQDASNGVDLGLIGSVVPEIWVPQSLDPRKMWLSSHLIAHGQTSTGPIVMKVRQCTTTFQDASNVFDLDLIGSVVPEIWVPQSLDPRKMWLSSHLIAHGQ